jgi:hypothetical protein
VASSCKEPYLSGCRWYSAQQQRQDAKAAAEQQYKRREKSAHNLQGVAAGQSSGGCMQNRATVQLLVLGGCQRILLSLLLLLQLQLLL